MSLKICPAKTCPGLEFWVKQPWQPQPDAILSGMSAPKSKFRPHALMLLTACGLSFFLVYWINKSYWDTKTYPEGRTALEMRHEFEWIEPMIDNLVKQYSLPLGVAFALALYGTMAAFLELGAGKKSIILAGSFLFTFPLLGLSWFLIPCFFAPLASLGVLIHSVVKNESKAVKLSALAIVQSIFTGIVSFNHAWDVDRLMGN
jgi:hypothetical protein